LKNIQGNPTFFKKNRRIFGNLEEYSKMFGNIRKKREVFEISKNVQKHLKNI